MFTKLLLRFSMMSLILFVLFIAVMTVTVQGQDIGKIDIDIEVTPHATLLAVGDPLTMTVNVQNNSIVSGCNLSDYEVSLIQSTPITPAFSFVSPVVLQGSENIFTFTLIATEATTVDFQALLGVDYNCPHGKTVILQPRLSQSIVVRQPQEKVGQQQEYRLYLPILENDRDFLVLLD